mgnify:CR=1 FL=1
MICCLHNGIVINGLSLNEERSAVLVEDNIILDVFSEQRFLQKNFGPDIKLIDVQGNYIIPGLIDGHTHISMMSKAS